MLIVNADDFGRSRDATDSALACYRRARISSISAMVFMADSTRGAKLATELGIDVGLHMNFSEPFTGSGIPEHIWHAHNRVRRFLCANKYALILYHPLLKSAFTLVFQAQAKEFLRLFGRTPSHVDGHQHMHLCSNILLQGLIPKGATVRRSFSFRLGQKSCFNRAYRACVDQLLQMNYQTTDFFFALSQHLPVARLTPIVGLARTHSVELMVHPQVGREYDCLMSEAYAAAVNNVQVGSYASLNVSIRNMITQPCSESDS
jgi:predicted glycoside hydrolase/deacetylase ChbG (UPF0249 family)